MTFQPIIPLAGLAGWKLLQATEETQRGAFAKDPSLKRDIEYFAENIQSATSAEKLVEDRRLLRVALGAFGLDDDLEKQALVKKVLEEGVLDPESFANRLVDQKYRDLATAFGYGDLGARVSDPKLSQKILAAYEARQFEAAVGETSDSLRLALNFRREIGEVSERASSENAFWLVVLGRPPLSKVFRTAMGIPDSVTSLDLDKQVEIFSDKFNAKYSLTEDGDGFALNAEEILTDFVVRSTDATNTAESYSVSLFQSSSSAELLNIVYS